MKTQRLQDGSMRRKILENLSIRFYRIQNLSGMDQFADFYYVTDFGEIWSDYKGWFLRPSATNSAGYLSVVLQRSGGGGRTLYVHSIVAALKFNRQLTNREQIRHLDGQKLNNRIENIGVGTSQDDANDRMRHRTAGKRLDPAQVRFVRSFAPLIGHTAKQRWHGMSQADVMRRAKISSHAIGPIATRAQRNDVPDIPDGAEGIITNFDTVEETVWRSDLTTPDVLVSRFTVLRSICKEHPDLWEQMKNDRKHP